MASSGPPEDPPQEGNADQIKFYSMVLEDLRSEVVPAQCAAAYAVARNLFTFRQGGQAYADPPDGPWPEIFEELCTLLSRVTGPQRLIPYLCMAVAGFESCFAACSISEDDIRNNDMKPFGAFIRPMLDAAHRYPDDYQLHCKVAGVLSLLVQFTDDSTMHPGFRFPGAVDFLLRTLQARPSNRYGQEMALNGLTDFIEHVGEQTHYTPNKFKGFMLSDRISYDDLSAALLTVTSHGSLARYPYLCASFGHINYEVSEHYTRAHTLHVRDADSIEPPRGSGRGAWSPAVIDALIRTAVDARSCGYAIDIDAPLSGLTALMHAARDPPPPRREGDPPRTVVSGERRREQAREVVKDFVRDDLIDVLFHRLKQPKHNSLARVMVLDIFDTDSFGVTGSPNYYTLHGAQWSAYLRMHILIRTCRERASELLLATSFQVPPHCDASDVLPMEEDIVRVLRERYDGDALAAAKQFFDRAYLEDYQAG